MRPSAKISASVPIASAPIASALSMETLVLTDGVMRTGRPFEEDRYAQTIEACCLLPDLSLLPAGDSTEVQ
jgi:hypothetical protein